MIFGNQTHKQVLREATILASGGAALLMQLADPAVADSVRNVSQFRKKPLARLAGTLIGAYAVTFGTPITSRTIEQFVREKHRGVPYANKPEHVMWVHGTLVYNAIITFELTVRELTPAEKENVYQGMRPNAVAFGCPYDLQPNSWVEFLDWFEPKLESFEITDNAREVADTLLYGDLPLVLRPFRGNNEILTRGLIGEHLRDGYRYSWNEDDQQKFDQMVGRMKQMVRLTPGVFRAAPATLFTVMAELQAGLIGAKRMKSSLPSFSRM